jgi:two-component system cell cycle sensor histidine kinase/response regulator CckA
MDLQVLIQSLALTIQLISLFFAIRLMRHSENQIIGIVFVLAIFLMSFRQLISLFRHFSHGTISLDMPGEMVALSISLLILSGIILISRFFKIADEDKRAAAFNETLYRTLFDQSPDGVLLMNMKGEIVEFNDAVNRQLGYTREEFKKLRISDIDPVESPAEIRESFKKVLQAGEFQFEVKHTTKQGDVRDVLVMVQRIELAGEIFFHTIWRDITESRRAEKNLIYIMKAIESTSDAIGISDSEEHHFYQNKAFSDLFGYITAEELEAAGGGPTVVNDPEVAKAMFDTIRQGESWVGELEMVTKSGRVFPAFERADAIRDYDGKLIGFIGIISDITERKKNEEALRESEDKFRSIFNEVIDGIMMADAETTRQTEANKSMCSMLGYTREELVGLRMDEIHPKEALPAIQGFFEKQRRGDVSLAPEIPMLRKDGSVFYADINATNLTLGGRQCLVGIFRDITERRQAEEKIQKSEEFIRNILDTVDEGFIVLDRDYRILTANSAYCGQVGDCAEKITGRHCYEVTHKSDQPCHEQGEECAVLQVFKTGQPHTALHRHADAEGNILYIETKAYPMKDHSGAVTSVIETISNITERYLLEEERFKSQKLESIGTLAGGIAHDFNNLLQGVFGYISVAKKSIEKKEESLAMLDQAEKALHLSVNLTTQLLTFAKGGKPAKKLISLRPVVENAVKFALSGSQTNYEMASSQDLRPLEADEGQLSQVIQNIVVNANEAMAGRGTVRISLSNVDNVEDKIPGLPGGLFLRIDIQDSGIGIPEQNLDRIFEPYFTTKLKGNGLGLATSYSIIKNHGGTIEVTSKKGKGTTFTIHLLAATDVIRKQETPHENSSGIRKGRILLMDDEELVRRVAKRMFEVIGHEADIASHGAKAVELFGQARESGTPYDLVILDLTVKGGMGGEEAIKKIREIDPHVVSVVSSGYGDSPVVADFHAHGFTASLDKPYTIESLQNCIETLLRKP